MGLGIVFTVVEVASEGTVTNSALGDTVSVAVAGIVDDAGPLVVVAVGVLATDDEFVEVEVIGCELTGSVEAAVVVAASNDGAVESFIEVEVAAIEAVDVASELVAAMSAATAVVIPAMANTVTMIPKRS